LQWFHTSVKGIAEKSGLAVVVVYGILVLTAVVSVPVSFLPVVAWWFGWAG
jgi:hypothetical protein